MIVHLFVENLTLSSTMASVTYVCESVINAVSIFRCRESDYSLRYEIIKSGKKGIENSYQWLNKRNHILKYINEIYLK